MQEGGFATVRSVGPAELEQRAERAVRRGELLAALEHFESYLADQPDDERVRQRMEAVRALLQPSELISRRRPDPEEAPQGLTSALSDAEQGEMHASSGRFADAILAYERAVAQSPANELLRERLEELRKLQSPTSRADLGAAEKLEAPVGAPGAFPRLARSARAVGALFSPLPGPPPDLPADPVGRLQRLLERIRAARRPR